MRSQVRQALLDVQMSYLHAHRDLPAAVLMQRYMETFGVSRSCYFNHRHIYRTSRENAVFRGGAGPHRPHGLIRTTIVEVYDAACVRGESLTSYELHAEVSRRVAAVNRDARVTLRNVRKLARKEGIRLCRASHVKHAHNPATNARRNEMSQVAMAAIQEAQREGVLIAAVDESSVQLESIAAGRRVFAGRNGENYSNLPANARSLKVNLMTFVMETGASPSFLYHANSNQRLFEQNLRSFLAYIAREVQPPNVLLLFDNAPYHTDRVLERARVDFPFFKWARLPVYSPDTNPAEFFFRMVKADIRRTTELRRDMSQDEWYGIVRAAVDRTQAKRESIQNNSAHALAVLNNLQNMTYPLAVAASHRR